MDLSVVVPTFRRPRLLESCLDALAQQDLDPEHFEVVVVDDGSGDETPQVLAGATGNVRAIVQAENRGPAAARNVGVRAARADLLLFLDDDVAAAPDLLRSHLAVHAAAQDGLLGVLGRVDWHPSLRVTRFMRWLDRSGLQFAYDTWLTEGPVSPPYAAFYTANLSLRRSLVLEAGGFDERFPYAAYEDMELAYRLTQRGFRLEYRPDARAFHTRAIDRRAFCARMQKVAHSAELLRRAAPDFPLDDGDLRRRLRRRRERLRLRAMATVGVGVNDWYWAEVAAAYEQGRLLVAPRP